jgi:acyl dehydratase
MTRSRPGRALPALLWGRQKWSTLKHGRTTRRQTVNAAALTLDTWVGPFADRFDAARLRRFAAATNEEDPRRRAGEGVPPGAAVTLLWSAQNAGRHALVSREFQEAASGGVHGEHDVVLHRPMTCDEPLLTWVEGWGARPAGANSVVTLHYVTRDAQDKVVVEQWWSTVWLGVRCPPDGAATPAHAFPEDARKRVLPSWVTDVDDGMARRYAEVSGDWSAHHFDATAARRSGSERPFLHGLCTLALCAKGVVDVVAGGDPDALRRIAVRFARPMPLGRPLEVQFFAVGTDEVAFEARCDGRTIVSNGRAHLS